MDNLRKAVWKANLSLHQNGLVYGTQGNVSGIDRKKGIVFIKPSGVSYENLSEKMIVGVDIKGRVLAGTLKPSVDTPHHLFLYGRIKTAAGVCHTHSRFVTAFSILKIDVPVLSTGHADVFGKPVPVTPYVDNKAENIGKAFISTYEKTGCPAIIIGSHGLFSIGETPEKAAFHALMAEYCAETSFYALLLGKILGKKTPPVEEVEIKKWYERYHSSGYGQENR